MPDDIVAQLDRGRPVTDAELHRRADWKMGRRQALGGRALGTEGAVCGAGAWTRVVGAARVARVARG